MPVRAYRSDLSKPYEPGRNVRAKNRISEISVATGTSIMEQSPEHKTCFRL